MDEDDLAVIKEAAARDGRPEAEYFREAFHIAALRARRWPSDWDIPEVDFGRPLNADDVHEIVAEATAACAE